MIEVLLIAGRSGVGKTTVSYEVSECLRVHDIPHALVDGDNLDAVYPPVDGPALTERNLAAIWKNYRLLGHDRLIYVNTVSVLEDAMIRRAIDEDVRISGVLLQSTDAAALERLARREIGTTLDVHLERSAAASALLEADAPAWVHRVPTDGRTVRQIAVSILHLTEWIA